MILAVEADGQKKKGRGVLKGVKALGGTVGMNYRSFKDEVVVINS